MSGSKIYQTVEFSDASSSLTQEIYVKGIPGGIHVGTPVTLTGDMLADGPTDTGIVIPDGFIFIGVITNILSANTGSFDYSLVVGPIDPVAPYSGGSSSLQFGDSSGTGFTSLTLTDVISSGKTIYFVGDYNGIIHPWSANLDIASAGWDLYAVIGTNPATRGSHIWYMVTPGICGASEPDWAAAEGAGTVIDGTVEWAEGVAFALDGSIVVYPVLVKLPTA